MRALVVLSLMTMLGACSMAPKPLRVCADPSNLPFSDVRQAGFENRIVDLIGHDLGRPIDYIWSPKSPGEKRNAPEQQRCDLWPGVASGMTDVDTTRPYYRSSYVFVTRSDRHLDVRSLDDPRLKRLLIGVQLVSDNDAMSPPTHALVKRGIISNVRGYLLYGIYPKPSPPSAIIQAVDRGDIDVALAWGPLAGYYARRSSHPLTITPIAPQLDGPNWPMAFDISMGVRKNDARFKQRIEGLLEKEAPRIDGILESYGVPQDRINPSNLREAQG